jgi:hypothetical protein
MRPQQAETHTHEGETTMNEVPPPPGRPTNHGFEKPTEPGTVFGQVRCNDQRVPTGKRFPYTASDGKTIWIAIKETRTIFHWVWDGTDWLTNEAFDEKYKRTAEPPKRPLVSKNSVNAIGEPTRWNRRK